MNKYNIFCLFMTQKSEGIDLQPVLKVASPMLRARNQHKNQNICRKH